MKSNFPLAVLAVLAAIVLAGCGSEEPTAAVTETVTREKDATGLDRLLVLDSNWEVVSQKPAAGKRVSEDATITLSSKKNGE